MKNRFGKRIDKLAKMTLGACLTTGMVIGSAVSVVVPQFSTVENVYAADSLTYTVGNSTYKYMLADDGDTCVITNYSGSDTEIKIPEKIDGKSVTSIGEWAFDGCSGLTGIEIPSSVTSIGNSAFYGCSSVTNIEIPSSVTSIGSNAFDYCSSVTSIKVDKNNTVYDSREDCNGIIETSSNELKCGCSNTRIPSNVTSIGEWAFDGCSGLTSIEIPTSVTSIGNHAFSDCSSLTSIEIPTSITSIENSTFSYCNSLTSIEIPTSVTSIGDEAFSYCSSLASIEIPSSVTSIGNYAFISCTSLTSIKIPTSVTSIERSTFMYCSSLTSIEIPSSVTSIRNFAFCGCSGLTSIKIPVGVTSIEGNAFDSCSNLKSVEIPTSVTSIGERAFWGCSSLTNIKVPSSVKSIGNWVFNDCDKNKLVISCYKGSEAYKYAVDNGYKYKLLTKEAKSTIKLNKSAVTLNPAKKITLTATTSPKGTKVTWKSSKTSVATVSSKGVVTAKKVGTAVITATTSDGVKAVCKVKIMNAPKSIELSWKKFMLDMSNVKKNKFVLKYTIPKNTYTTVKYFTSNKKVATVSSKGVITPLKKGVTVITVKTDNGKVAKCKVIVR